MTTLYKLIKKFKTLLYFNLLLHFNIFFLQRKTQLLSLCLFQKNSIQTFSQCLFWNRMICLPEVKNSELTTCIIIFLPFPNHTKVRIKILKGICRWTKIKEKKTSGYEKFQHIFGKFRVEEEELSKRRKL